MIERYRKRGRVVRFERDSIITVDEAGQAIENGEIFSARPLEHQTPLDAADEDVGAFARDIRARVSAPVEIERLLVSAGTAEHEFANERWRESTARVHIALVNRSQRLRATLDLGAAACAEISLREVSLVADALARAAGRAPSPEQMILAPNVTAAMLPALIRADGVTLIQSAGGTDGKGAPIEERVIAGALFPNWFRPSYRVRPVRMPFNLRAKATATAIDAAVPRVLAVTGGDGRHFQVLCDDAGRVFETAIEMTRVRAVGPPSDWYPYGAGAFGSEMLL